LTTTGPDGLHTAALEEAAEAVEDTLDVVQALCGCEAARDDPQDPREEGATTYGSLAPDGVVKFAAAASVLFFLCGVVSTACVADMGSGLGELLLGMASSRVLPEGTHYEGIELLRKRVDFAKRAAKAVKVANVTFQAGERCRLRSTFGVAWFALHLVTKCYPFGRSPIVW
jgi:hypothetical protein